MAKLNLRAQRKNVRIAHKTQRFKRTWERNVSSSNSLILLERAKGFEPSTLTLAT
jgi:hypothetical protein